MKKKLELLLKEILLASIFWVGGISIFQLASMIDYRFPKYVLTAVGISLFLYGMGSLAVNYRLKKAKLFRQEK